MGYLRLDKRLWAILALAVFVWWVRYHPPGVDLVVLDDDARQHVYWTARFKDPELFREDLLTEFISSTAIAPLGYKAVYRLGVEILDPLPLSQFLTLVLLIVSLMGLEGLLRGLEIERRGRAFALFLFLFYSLYDSSGGLPRGFAFPTLIWFLAFYVREAPVGQAIVIFSQSLLYPPILLNTMAMGALGVLRSLAREGRLQERAKRIAPVVAACLLSTFILLWVYAGAHSELLGSQVSFAEARSMPEFHENGRSKFFRDNTLEYLLLGRSGIGATRLMGFLIILAGMVFLGGRGVLRIPKTALELTWTSIALFLLAHLLLFRLHLPSRYTMYTLPLAFLITIGATTPPFLRALKERCQGLLSKIQSIPRPMRWALLALALASYSLVQGHLIVTRDTQVATVDKLEREMLAFLETLPKSALVAGHPMDMDDVPLLAKKKVLANRELSLPYHTGYYSKVKERLLDLFRAYYASSWEEVEAFVTKYGITALVVNKEHFANNSSDSRIYFEPFDSFVKELIRGRKDFVLSFPPSERICFENGRYFVLCWKS